ncbi:MAG: DUF485 domain-containing protein [Thermodesulfovibrionales bacterium]|nr:DUF485 domain-containing protein [Thermodesulfovibrionales bacterium]
MMKREQILKDPDFRALKNNKWKVSIILGSLVMILYFGFVLLMAYNKPLFANKIFGIYVGIPIGIFVLVSTILITVVYVIWANNNYDVLVEKVKDKIRG